KAGVGDEEVTVEEIEARDGGRTLRQLISLAEKSLVLPARGGERAGGGPRGLAGHNGEPEEPEEEDEDAEPAFGMLETVRGYAQEQVVAEGELAAARRAHAHYFLALAERAARQLRGRDQRVWYVLLEREQGNLRAALRWLLDQDGPDGSDAAAEQEAGLRLAA